MKLYFINTHLRKAVWQSNRFRLFIRISIKVPKQCDIWYTINKCDNSEILGNLIVADSRKTLQTARHYEEDLYLLTIVIFNTLSV